MQRRLPARREQFELGALLRDTSTLLSVASQPAQPPELCRPICCLWHFLIYNLYFLFKEYINVYCVICITLYVEYLTFYLWGAHRGPWCSMVHTREHRWALIAWTTGNTWKRTEWWMWISLVLIKHICGMVAIRENWHLRDKQSEQYLKLYILCKNIIYYTKLLIIPYR